MHSDRDDAASETIAELQALFLKKCNADNDENDEDTFTQASL